MLSSPADRNKNFFPPTTLNLYYAQNSDALGRE